MGKLQKKHAIINTILSSYLLIPALIISRNPVFIIGFMIAAFLSMLGFPALHEHPSTEIKGYSSARLLIGGVTGLGLFDVAAFTVVTRLAVYYPEAVSYKSFPIILALSLLASAVMYRIALFMYDSYSFSTCIVPPVGFFFAGCVILWLFKNYFLVCMGTVCIVAGGICTISVFSSLLNVYTPVYHYKRFYAVRHIVLFLSAAAGLILGAVTDARFGFFIAALTTIAVTGALPIATLFIRQSHFDLMTEEGERLSNRILRAFTVPEKEPCTWQMYPRPQLVRAEWQNLNGVWRLNHGTVYVPFPPQSTLSGYRRPVIDFLTYERKFVLSEAFRGKKTLLHFGAVDQTCDVYVNGIEVGSHAGGYLPFSFDISEAVRMDGENTITVKVVDTLSPAYPYGKQRRNRGGMWYTPVSGIWKTVWLEPVPKEYIKEVKLSPDLNKVNIEIKISGKPSELQRVKCLLALDNGQIYEYETEDTTFAIDLSEIKNEDGTNYEPRRWSTKDPYLYSMRIIMGQDEVSTYFGLRTVRIDYVSDVPRVMLNDRPVYLHGVLDQGYYPDGIYTPASESEYEKDLLRIKELGFNFVRKHIKIEPEIFYYYCDKLGILCMQDMVNSGVYRYLWDTILPSFASKTTSDKSRLGTKKRKEFFLKHSEDTIKHLHNHPSVIAYTIFNEGWGQFEADKAYAKLKNLDPTRLYDATSGWFVQTQSDFDSHHQYYTSVKFPVNARPMIVSECGGFSYRIPNHYYSMYNIFSYGVSRSKEELTGMIRKMYDDMIFPVIREGGCGCVYTQLSDVEDETNGLFTYDRKICKVDRDVLLAISARIKEEIGL